MSETDDRRLGRAAAQAMGMSEAVWARHANPWSVYTRIPLLMLLALAIWSRVWLGWWALPLIGAVIFWAFINPRAFPPPGSTENWASKGVFGERIWLNAGAVPIPAHHALWARGLTWTSAAALAPTAWGLWALEPWAAFLGAALSSLLKLWFVDRMVWLYEDMKDADPAYAAWRR